MSKFKTKEIPCPWCERLFDGVMNVAGDLPPDPGDYSVCINCHRVIAFSEDMQSYRRVQLAELVTLPDEILAGILNARAIVITKGG